MPKQTDFSAAVHQPFRLQGKSGAPGVLFVHGFTGSPANMLPLAQAVNRAGYTCAGIRLPGHCESLEALGRSGGEQWLEAVEQAYAALKAECRVAAACGLSLGGALCVRLAELRDVDALVLLAPALKMAHWYDNLAPVVQHVVKEMPWKRSRRYREGYLTEYGGDYGGFRVDKVADMLRLDKAALADLDRVTCPTLVCQSRLDESVHRSVPGLLMERIGSDVKEVAWFANSPHVLNLGGEREAVFAAVTAFLAKRMPADA